ncbi:MAG: hypothetical protein ABJB74_06135 [Gemmatimonas sp.]
MTIPVAQREIGRLACLEWICGDLPNAPIGCALMRAHARRPTALEHSLTHADRAAAECEVMVDQLMQARKALLVADGIVDEGCDRAYC